MPKSRRTPMEPRQIEEARALKRLFGLRTKLSQEEFGAAYEIGTQGAVWQYLNGHRPLNLRVANAFARGLNVAVSDFSPTLAAQLAGAPTETGKMAKIISVLPSENKRAVLDFLQYQITRIPSGRRVAEDVSRYLEEIDELKRHLSSNDDSEKAP